MLGLILATAASLATPPATAQPLDPVVVVSSRAAEPLSQVVSSVAQIDRDQIERLLVRDLESLVRYVPGVSVSSDAHRFGARGFAIRGLDGNRVRIVVDGVPLDDEFSVGQFAAAGRDLVDLEAIEQVEIQRGPASTLYGSDALAGVVSFRSRDPQSLLAHATPDHPDHVIRTRLGYDGLDHSVLSALSWAAQLNADWQVMVLAAQRQGHEISNHAEQAEHAANPAHRRRRSVLAKAVRDAGAAGRYTLTLDASEQQQQTVVNSLRFGSGRFATTTQLDGDDAQQRLRGSFSGEWAPQWPGLDRIEAQLYWQHSDVRQDSEQYRLADRATPFASLRFRRFDYRAQTVGGSVLAQTRSHGAGLQHWQVFGVDVRSTRYRGLRDGLETNLESGEQSTLILGERLPVRDFPTTDSDSAALFWQDELRLGEALALVPGVRAEYNQLRSHPDALYRDDVGMLSAANTHSQQITPRLALRWRVAAGHSVFAQYARGFRAPPFSDVNIALTLPIFNYEVRANPDLKPERSDGVELGWRFVGSTLRASVSVYDNRYRDLIESRANLGVDADSGALVFQSINRDRARIRGVEADLLWRLGEAGQPQGWQLRGAAALAHGTDQRREQPLNSIDPARLSLGLQYALDHGAHGVELASVAVRRKTQIDNSEATLFAPPGSVRWDAYLWATPWPQLQINVGIQNLTNQRYWAWSSVRGVLADADDLDFYTRPGRSVALNLALSF